MSISEAHRPGVDRALQSAFGCTNLDTISPLSGGMSGAAIYRIRVGGIAYLLRIEGGRDSFRNPERWHRCMRIAADAALAPRVRYADAGDGVAIMDFLPEQPLALDYAGDRADLMTDLAQTIRALHQAPAFPSLVDYMDGMDAILGPFLASGILDPQATTALFARFAQVQAAWRSDPADLVSSHNDLNPRNILYDGRRLWLVDWESSFLADRYVDLAALANFFAHDAAEEEILRARDRTLRERPRDVKAFFLSQFRSIVASQQASPPPTRPASPSTRRTSRVSISSSAASFGPAFRLVTVAGTPPRSMSADSPSDRAGGPDSRNAGPKRSRPRREPPARGLAAMMRSARRENGSVCRTTRPGPVMRAKKRPSPPKSAVLMPGTVSMSNTRQCALTRSSSAAPRPRRLARAASCIPRRGLGRVHELHPQLVDQALQQLGLGFVEVALGLLLEHPQDIDEIARGVEVEVRVGLAAGVRDLAQGHHRRRRQ